MACYPQSQELEPEFDRETRHYPPAARLIQEESRAEAIAAAERAAAAAEEQEPVYIAEGIIHRPIKKIVLGSSTPAETIAVQEVPEPAIAATSPTIRQAAVIQAGHLPLNTRIKGLTRKLFSLIGTMIGWAFVISFYLILHIATFAAYGAIILFTCIIPLPIVGKIVSALFFGGMAAVLTLALAQLWGGTNAFRRRTKTSNC